MTWSPVVFARTTQQLI